VGSGVGVGAGVGTGVGVGAGVAVGVGACVGFDVLSCDGATEAWAIKVPAGVTCGLAQAVRTPFAVSAIAAVPTKTHRWSGTAICAKPPAG
jgi:hypothetical protein